MSTPYTMMWYQPSGPSWMATPYTLFGMDMVEVKAWHTVGKEHKIDSNLKDIEFDIEDTHVHINFNKNQKTLEPDATPRPRSGHPP